VKGTQQLGATAFGIGAVQGQEIHWLLTLVLGLFGLGLVGWGIYRAIQVQSLDDPTSKTEKGFARGDQALKYLSQALVIAGESG